MAIHMKTIRESKLTQIIYRKFQIHDLSVILNFELDSCVNSKTNPISKRPGLAMNPESFAPV